MLSILKRQVPLSAPTLKIEIIPANENGLK